MKGEVTRVLDEECERQRLLRGQRHIGDFTRWKEHDAYGKALDRLLRDLKVEAS